MAVRYIERLMDLRTIQRNIESGLITKEQVTEYLESLPDVSDNIETLSIPDGDDLDDDDDDYEEDEDGDVPTDE
ncbi:MAG: hypothetical protein R3B09_00535 [Nannocystaceae bacterium]